MSQEKKKIFLTAEWRQLILANYEVPPQHLLPYVPKGTELDLFEGKCYMSLVGFLFLKTKVLGLKIPFHQNFEEFNLRFYVKRKVEDQWRRGVVFIKEIVPKPAIAYTAKLIYREPYVAMPMKHIIHLEKGKSHDTSSLGELYVAYSFYTNSNWERMAVFANATAEPFEKNSIPDFITEHYWGYNKYSKDITMEYEVEHPSWNIHSVTKFDTSISFEKLYGDKLAEFLYKGPASVLLAQGSEVLVRKGNKLTF